jgi:hypothetical protein
MVTGRARPNALEAVGAGFGKDVNLGQLVLGSTTTVTGVVRRADVSGPSGHGGITVFAPQLRPLTFTGDDGAFVLEGLPEGELAVAAAAPGYDNAEVTITLGSGEEKRLSPLTLRRTPAGAEATLTGQDRTVDGPLGQVTVRVLRGASEVSTSTGVDGVFTFSAQPVGLTLLVLEKAGFAPLLVSNVAVDAPSPPSARSSSPRAPARSARWCSRRVTQDGQTQAAWTQGTRTQGTRMQGTPMQGTPMQGTQMQGTQMQGTQMQDPPTQDPRCRLRWSALRSLFRLVRW